jgi:glycerophosphoryl diester phosphodiesterase
MTEIIAHRGGADLWPENTMAAFAGAIACGADGAELDVHLTRDGQVVVFHDEALKPEIVRGPDGQWLTAKGPQLKDMNFSEVLRYDVGRLKPGTRYAAQHPAQEASDGEHIPLLADVIAMVKARSATFKLWIELKTDLMRPERGADPVRLAEAALAVVRDQDFDSRTVFISFDWRALVPVKALAPHIPALATTLPQSWFQPGEPPKAHWPPPPDELAAMRATVAAGAPWEAGFPAKDYPSLQHAVRASGADGWFPFHPDVTHETAERTRALGLQLAAWTVPADQAAPLVRLGCSAICTDDPVRTRDALSGADPAA